jgi:predicted O-methyltransferase YrrM
MSVDLSAEGLLAKARAFTEARILLTGAELDLFSLLAAEALDAQQVAQRRGGQLRAMTMLLDALAALGLLDKQQGRYQTAAAVAPLLAAGGERSVLPMVLHAASMWRTWDRLTEVVSETGAPRRPAADSRDEQGLRAFIGAMHVIGSRAAPGLVAAIDPGAARALLDVGGGPGTYTAAFLEACPGMRATLFDRPPVVELARENLRRAGVLDRVRLVAGSYLTDDLPGGHDLALLSAVIHSNSLEQNLTLYRRVLAALEPGGRVVIRDHVMEPDRLRPVPGAVFAINMLVATEGGGCYTLAEIRQGLEQAGFEGVRLIQTGDRMNGLVEAFKPPGRTG